MLNQLFELEAKSNSFGLKKKITTFYKLMNDFKQREFFCQNGSVLVPKKFVVFIEKKVQLYAIRLVRQIKTNKVDKYKLLALQMK